MVLGIEDPWIWGVYVLIILSTLLCVVYGICLLYTSDAADD